MRPPAPLPARPSPPSRPWVPPPVGDRTVQQKPATAQKAAGPPAPPPALPRTTGPAAGRPGQPVQQKPAPAHRPPPAPRVPPPAGGHVAPRTAQAKVAPGPRVPAPAGGNVGARAAQPKVTPGPRMPPVPAPCGGRTAPRAAQPKAPAGAGQPQAGGVPRLPAVVGMPAAQPSGPPYAAGSVAQPACLKDCWNGFIGLFSSCSSNNRPQRVDDQSSDDDQTGVGLDDVERERINEPSLCSQDNVAGKAYSLDATGMYYFGLISGCTIVYARGATSSTASHHFGINHRDYLTAAMKKNIRQKEGGDIVLVKVFFSAESGQDHAVLTKSQATFATEIGEAIGGAVFEYYAYDPYVTTVNLGANGNLVGVSGTVTRAHRA